MPIARTELILNNKNAVYHLNLHPQDIAPTIILVGDPGRVKKVSSFFDTIELKTQNREFITRTGYIGKKRITVLSTGIGTDNIDIVMNELDSLVNINLRTREPAKNKKSLDIVRIGTCGALQEDIPVDSFVISEYGLGLDGLMYYYKSKSVIEKKLVEHFVKYTKWNKHLPYPYAVKGSENLIKKLGQGYQHGITATAPGFYAPQGRRLRINPSVHNLTSTLEHYNFHNKRILNFEMETSAIYGLGRLMGHNTCTVCTTVANRVTKKFSPNYSKAINKLITEILERLTS